MPRNQCESVVLHTASLITEGKCCRESEKAEGATLEFESRTTEIVAYAGEL